SGSACDGGQRDGLEMEFLRKGNLRTTNRQAAGSRNDSEGLLVRLEKLSPANKRVQSWSREELLVSLRVLRVFAWDVFRVTIKPPSNTPNRRIVCETIVVRRHSLSYSSVNCM